MIIPIRCWSCGKPIAHTWASYKERTEQGEPAQKVLNDLGIQRYCCRSIMLGHVDLAETVARFKKA